MHKLSGLDASFLYLESPETPMHIAGLSICEMPPGHSGNPYEEYRAQLAARLHEIPSFHRRLAPTPFAIDHPYWVNADEVDFDYHVRHAALPRPGTPAQLRALVERLHSQPLDRSRPLWQFHVIEGLETGHFALYTKMHHACLDGGGGIMAMDILSDSEPTPRPPLPHPTVRLQTREPGVFEMIGSAYGHFMQQGLRMLQAAPTAVQAIFETLKLTAQGQGWSADDLQAAPRTRFNTRIGAQRALGYASIPVAEAKAVGKAFGGTINDVVMAISGGALRAYLERHGELPEKSLVAAVPVSLREVGNTDNSNQVTSVLARIGTHIADPVERIEFVRGAMAREKVKLGAVKDVIPQDFAFFGAPMMAMALAWAMGKTSAVEKLPVPMNVTISNVPAGRKHVYFAGAKVVAYFPVSIPTHGCALNITLHGYVDRLDFGLTACRKAVPDVQDIADGMMAEFARLKAAAEAGTARPAPKAEAKPAAKPAARPRRAKAAA